ncbi:MAG TPA: DUF3429 domain-containing protein [Rhodanobacteraceae bacterium]|nr:DUF3429 domain-containing protein [Rhodanobacteraceae bacterium]
MRELMHAADAGRDAYAWAGVVPFVAAALGACSPDLRSWATLGFIAYGACILSFLGGLRWGRGLVKSERAAPWAGSVWSSLVATAAIVLAPSRPVVALGLLTVGFAAMGWQDVGDAGWPPDFRRLRRRLSFVVVGLHLALSALLLAR